MDFFRGEHSWRKLRVILDRLPSTSAFRAAMVEDPEVAEAIAGQPAGGPSRPAWGEYPPERAALDSIFDRLGELIAAVYNANGGKAKPPPPLPRPVTAVDRARARRERVAHTSLEAQVAAAQERWQQRRQLAR